MFKPGTPGVKEEAQRITQENGGQLVYTYENAIQGFAARLSPDKLEGIARNPNVQHIEEDNVTVVEAVQRSPSWGLDRIDQRYTPLNGGYTYDVTASGVHAYVIDTGVRSTHQEFSGRMGNGIDVLTGSIGPSTDCNGHGTHVAGTLGGTTYGVAKGVTLHGVRVLNCAGSGSESGVIAGVDWVTANHVKPAVANMSLGGAASTALDGAVRNSIAAGITYVVAAGNDNTNACNTSPARVPEAITVGATTSTDFRASYSNYGSCLDLFAPGSSIKSAWNGSDSATNTISGTSMASPHVAGVSALVLTGRRLTTPCLCPGPNATPTQVRDSIMGSATPCRLSNVNGAQDWMLFSLLTTPPHESMYSGLANGDFEQGPKVAWNELSSSGYSLVSTKKPESGAWGAWLGGYDSATESIKQLAHYPPAYASQGYELVFDWRMETFETSTSTIYDYLEVRLYDGATGAYLATPWRVGNTATRNMWQLSQVSLHGFLAGDRKVHIEFFGKTDSSLPSSFFVDQVRIRARDPGGGTINPL